MTRITAILHTHNDEQRIARAVESLRCCDEVLVLDSASTDDTCRVARAFGARVIEAAKDGLGERAWTQEAANDWIFRVSAAETVSEALEASLLEWKLAEDSGLAAVSVSIVEEIHGGWARRPAERRLANRSRGGRGADAEDLHILDGGLLRLMLP